MAELDYNLLIISDLHLSEGFRPLEGRLSPNEDFLSDEGFADFLRFHNELRRQLDRPWRLILAGDLFDFLQVTSLSATNAEELADGIARLRKGKPVLARSLDDPKRRCARAVEWLDEAIALMKAKSAGTHQAVIECAEELKACAPGVEDALVWDLERLALETWILAFKPRAELSASDRKFGLGTSWPETVWKLDRIAEGHSVLFSSLAWFLDQGNELVLMKGNHDVELHWPQAQARMPDLLADAHAHLRLSDRWWTAQPMNLTMDQLTFWSAVQTRFSFCPWIYFEPGLLYLEHGNQYEVLDAFPDFLNPTLSHDERLIRLPPGSFFSRYFFNKVEQSFSFADNLRPVTRFIAWAFQNRFWATVGLFAKYRAELWHFGRELIRRGVGDYLQDRKQQKERESAAYQTALHASARGPLSPEHQEKIGQLALEERSKLVSKILHYGIVALPILVFVLIALGLLGIFVVPAFSAWIFPQNYFLRLIISGAVAFGIKYLLAPAIASLVRVRDYLLKPAQRVWEILQEPMGSDEAPRVRYLVFGHTHEPNMQRLGREKDAPWYINTGSWLYAVSEVESWERLDRDFIFLQIVPGQEAEIPRLFRWNEATGRPERIRRRLPESPHDRR